MSLWYRNGTIAVTNGSTGITGTGTAWVDASISVGSALHAPDGRVYEVVSVASATSMTVTPAYLGSTASGQTYAIQPTLALAAAWRASAQAMLAAYDGYAAGPLVGKWPDGSAAAPSLTFASDVDTGFYRPAANQLGAATAGVLRWLLSTSAFQINVPITGSAVQSSPVDTTAGRVLLVGAFGVGDATNCPTASDLNDAAMAAGLYRITTSTANRPFDLGTVIILRNGTARITQMAHRLVSGASSDVLSIRHHHDGTWSSWKTVFHSGNAVGTVSQASGVPTGALIERGSNANGEYVRFADGTQICWCLAGSTQTADQATGNGFRASADVSFTYPVAFSAAPHVMPAGRYSSGAASWTVPAVGGSPTGTVARIYAFVTGAVGTPGIVAINRWF